MRGFKPGQVLAVVALVVVAATLAAAIGVVGGPAAQRQVRLDERRLDDLRGITSAVDAYVADRDAMPSSLAAIAGQPGWDVSVVDPDGARYDYAVTQGRRYRLCAVFATDTASGADASVRWREQGWAHGRGRQCFQRIASPDKAIAR